MTTVSCFFSFSPDIGTDALMMSPGPFPSGTAILNFTPAGSNDQVMTGCGPRRSAWAQMHALVCSKDGGRIWEGGGEAVETHHRVCMP